MCDYLPEPVLKDFSDFLSRVLETRSLILSDSHLL